MTLVYHFTDTCRLPFILDAGELRPTRRPAHVAYDWPNPDFVWATTDATGDRTATANGRPDGVTLAVRFMLHAEDFEPWRSLVARSPHWKPEHVDKLLTVASEVRADPSAWVACHGPLPSARWIAIHVRAWNGHWRLFDRRARVEDGPGGGGSRMIEIDGRGYYARQHRLPDGRMAYTTGRPLIVSGGP